MDGVLRIPLADSAAGEPGGSRGVTTLRWFVAGPENALACAAADAVMRRDATLGSVLLCGPSGVGKSHLARGLAWRLEERLRDACLRDSALPGAVHVLQAADITSDEAIAPRRRAGMGRSRLTDLQVLVVEDVGDLRDRPIAQQQLLHHLDELASWGAMALLTSRVPPAELRELMPALRSRLVGGLVVPIAMPDVAARRALLTDWAALLGVSILDEAADLLAAGLAVAPPQLRGAVVSLGCRLNGDGAPVDLAAARAYLAHHGRWGDIPLRTVATTVGRYFGVTLAELKSSSRRRQVVEARAMAIYLARRLTGLSLERIGEYFGGRDHTTVLYNCQRTQELQSSDAATRQAALALEDAVKRKGRSPSGGKRSTRKPRQHRGKRVAPLAVAEA